MYSKIKPIIEDNQLLVLDLDIHQSIRDHISQAIISL